MKRAVEPQRSEDLAGDVAARLRSGQVGAAYYEHCAQTGNPTWTAMIFLNVPQDGGATRFKRVGKTIQPEVGKLLV